MGVMIPSEAAALLGTIDPDALTAGAHTSDWCDMGLFKKALAVVSAGTLGSSATFDAKLQQATDSSGTGAKDITGKAITQLTQAGSDSDKQALINVDAAELDTANNFTHVALVITVATATSDGSGHVFGFEPRFGPSNDNDLASVDEIVN